jgi:hypothetical protein
LEDDDDFEEFEDQENGDGFDVQMEDESERKQW